MKLNSSIRTSKNNNSVSLSKCEVNKSIILQKTRANCTAFYTPSPTLVKAARYKILLAI